MKHQYRQSALSRENSKIRVLAIKMMLDGGGVISTRTIMRRLELQYGMRTDRKTIMSDVRAIDRITPVEVIAGPKGGYRKLDVLGGGIDDV